MGGFREDAARHPSRASAQAAGSHARCTRSAGPQNAMHARGSTPHPRRHRRHTPTNTTTKDIQGGRAGTRETPRTESKRLAPLKDCRRATDLSKPLSPPKSEAKSSTPETTVPNANVHIRTHIAQQSGASRSRHVAECPAGPWICELLGSRVRSVGPLLRVASVPLW